MKKFVSFLLCVSVVVRQVPAQAEVHIQEIPPGEDKIVPLKKGEPAPFDGQLFDTPTALRWGNWLLQYRLRLQADVEYQKKLGAADLELWKHKYELLDTKYVTVTSDYQKKVTALEVQNDKLREEITNPPWYRSQLFGFVTGIVVTGACVGLGFYTYSSLSK